MSMEQPIGLQSRLTIARISAMMQFRSTEKKAYKTGSQSRKQYLRAQSIQALDNSSLKLMDRNDNVNFQLHSNYSQLRELLKQRKALIHIKHEQIINKNQEKVSAIMQARDHDLKNEAKGLNDYVLMNLIEQTQSLNKSRSLIQRVAEIRDMSAFLNNQMGNGKRLWDRHKEVEREKKKKSQNYINIRKQLKEMHQRQRSIFCEIERYENEIVSLLLKNREDPQNFRRAERLNEQIEKKKASLRDVKAEKSKIKADLQNIIDELIDLCRSNQEVMTRRLKQIDDCFGGNENVNQFDNIIVSLEKMFITKVNQNKQQKSAYGVQSLSEVLKSYDIVIQEVQKLKEEQDHIFTAVNEELKQNIKNKLIEKILISGVPVKSDPNELFKKLKEYRRLLVDSKEEKPRVESEIYKFSSLCNQLYPIKKQYANEETRKEELRQQLKKLCEINSQLEEKEREQKNFHFNLEELIHRRRLIEQEIHESAKKVNLAEYKNKMKELEAINKKISEKNDGSLNQQLLRLRSEIEDYKNYIYKQYEELINEVYISEEQPSLGVFLAKLEKRLSLI